MVSLPLLNPQAAGILQHPGRFALQVLKAFRANQGLLLAGAVAYYALLSMVPLAIVMVIALSHVIDPVELFATMRRAFEYVAPGQGRQLVRELETILEHREVIGWVLLAIMILFSALGFKVLENAISVIFLHRVATRRRPLAMSLALPFGYIVFLGAALFFATLVFAELIHLGDEDLVLFGHSWSLGGVARLLLYLAGVLAEIVVISSVYYFMPVGRMSPRHALIGGATAGLLWEVLRHALGWYLAKVSRVDLVYGSMTTAIVVLLSIEIAATLLLLGAQVIAEYERVGEAKNEPPAPLHTEAIGG